VGDVADVDDGAVGGADGQAVQLVELDGRLWRENTALRDYLRAHPEEAAAYAEAKRAAIAGGATTLLAYSAAKAPTLAALTERARAWGAAA